MFEQLKKHHNDIANRSILSLFDTVGRAEDYRCQLGDMVFDYSKTNIGVEARVALIDLVQICDVAGGARAMFAGGKGSEPQQKRE